MGEHTVRQQIDYVLGRDTGEEFDFWKVLDDGYPLWQSQLRERVQRAQSRRQYRRNMRVFHRACRRTEREVQRLRRERGL